MPETNSEKQHTMVGQRSLILVASTAMLGATVLLAGPGGSGPASLSTSVGLARAADATTRHPASFADLVAKVKPAVISVQVKIDNSAKMTGMNQNGKGHIPSAPGSQMDRFF